MYEVGLTKTFRALHVMPGMEGPEGELHPHEYRMEVTVGRSGLDRRAMVVDLDVLEAAVTGTVAQIQDQDLERIRPDDAEAVTVETLSRWAHGEIASLLRQSGADALSIRVWESPVAFGGYAAPLADSSP
ncbi:MAG: 6-pyruvoyl tetrahydropterin synthase family protein [Actinomycetota bacterium]